MLNSLTTISLFLAVVTGVWLTQPSTAFGGTQPQLSLHVSSPNGGETLVAGSIVALTWDGVPADSRVKLEYSTDAGSTWLAITDTAVGLRYDWRVPKTPSDRCLLRATVVEGLTIAPSLVLRGTPNGLFSATYSPDGTIVATMGETDDRVRLWDAQSGVKLREFVQDYALNPDHGAYGRFSPDGSMMVVFRRDSAARVWDVSSGQLLDSFFFVAAREVRYSMGRIQPGRGKTCSQ